MMTLKQSIIGIIKLSFAKENFYKKNKKMVEWNRKLLRDMIYIFLHEVTLISFCLYFKHIFVNL